MDKIQQLKNLNYTWFSQAVLAISEIPYNPNQVFARYSGKTTISDVKGQHIQFIQKRWFPKVTDTDELVYIDAKYQYRPDIISVDYYNSPAYAWALLAANDIRSVFELKAGMYIKVPNLARVLEGLN